MCGHQNIFTVLFYILGQMFGKKGQRYANRSLARSGEPEKGNDWSEWTLGSFDFPNNNITHLQRNILWKVIVHQMHDW